MNWKPCLLIFLVLSIWNIPISLMLGAQHQRIIDHQFGLAQGLLVVWLLSGRGGAK